MKGESNSAIKISKVLLGKPTSLLGFTFTNLVKDYLTKTWSKQKQLNHRKSSHHE